MKYKIEQKFENLRAIIRRTGWSLVFLAFCLVSVVQGFAQPASLIYSADFEFGAGPEWSYVAINRTPVGSRGYLGPFGNGQTNLLTLHDLPPHTNLTVMLNLFAIGSWDGNGDNCCGPDRWEMRSAGETNPILRTSFSASEGNLPRQAYPASYPGGDNPPRSGAWAVNSLGFSPASAIYQMSVSFTHSSETLNLSFASISAGTADESWGLDSIAIHAGNAPKIQITSLTNHQAFAAPANVAITAVVIATNEPVQAVEFYANQTLLVVFTNSPFSFSWTNAPAGMHTIRARVKTEAGIWSDELVQISVNGLKGDYFRNTTLSGQPTTRVDSALNFAWHGNSPIPGIPAGSFSARWTGFVVPRFSENYSISTFNDDGVRVWVGGRMLIDSWSGQDNGRHTNQIDLLAGKAYPIQVDYFNGSCCDADMQLFWQSQSQPYQIIPQSQLYPPGSFPPPLSIRRISDSRAVVEWSTNTYGFHLASADHLASESWTNEIPTVNSTVTNGLNSVTIDSTVRSRFFKLAR